MTLNRSRQRIHARLREGGAGAPGRGRGLNGRDGDSND